MQTFIDVAVAPEPSEPLAHTVPVQADDLRQLRGGGAVSMGGERGQDFLTVVHHSDNMTVHMTAIAVENSSDIMVP